MSFRSRIIGHGEEAPDQLLANPMNWRIHPKAQQEALEGVLAEVGWVGEVVVNHRTGTLLDGHLRVLLAMRHEEPTVPVRYVDLHPEEEALILATLDPLGALAVTDREKLEDLMAEVRTGSPALQKMLADLGEREGLSWSGGADDDTGWGEPEPESTSLVLFFGTEDEEDAVVRLLTHLQREGYGSSAGEALARFAVEWMEGA